MALEVIATPGAVDANSYATEAFAEGYHEGHPRAEAWTDGDDDEKKWALIEATRRLDALVTWKGTVATTTQRLLWPRTEVVDKRGVDIPDDEVPEAVQEATSEFARQLLEDDRTADSDVQRLGLKRIKAGPIDLEFTGKDAAADHVVPDAAMALIAHLIEVEKSAFIARLIRT